jgi:hypothetical protein
MLCARGIEVFITGAPLLLVFSMSLGSKVMARPRTASSLEYRDQCG